jgi:hypothetical protein
MRRGCSSLSRRSAGAALFSILLVAVAVPVAPLSAAIAPDISPVGTYRAVISGNFKSRLDVFADHTFRLKPRSSGTWAQLGEVIALGITEGPGAVAGCIFMGKVNDRGISAPAKPGVYDCNSSNDSPWYANRLSSQTSEEAASAVSQPPLIAARAGARPSAQSATGSYTAFYSNGSSSVLDVNADRTVAWPDFGDSGTWEQFGQTAAFLVTVNETGCLDIGKVTKAGINSLAAPGPYVCPTLEGTWYADRNP